MATAVTPSREPMSDGQLDKLVDIFRAALRKARAGLDTKATQQVLEMSDLGAELVALVRTRIEAVSELIVRVVKVDRSRTSKQALDATVHTQYVSDAVVKSMPKGEGEEVEVVFFKLGRYVSDDELEKEYALRGLKPADAYSLAQVNADDPAFSDEHPNSTHWRNDKGQWCYAFFSGWDGERRVRVNQFDDGWFDIWWFAGVRK